VSGSVVDVYATSTGLSYALSRYVNSKLFCPVGHIDLIITEDCNGCCDYCFMEGKRPRAMDAATAERAVQFLLDHCGDLKTVNLLFFGGEPLLEFGLIQHIIAYCERRSAETGKKFAFSITTNGTLLTPPMLAYFNRQGVKFLLSLDGTREMHNRHRKLKSGESPWDIVVSKLPLFKRYQPWQGTRLTLMPDTAHMLVEGVETLYKLGVNQFIIGPATGVVWGKDALAAYEQSLKDLSLIYLERQREREPFRMTLFEQELERKTDYRGVWGCGGGRGRMSVTPAGEVQACAKVQGADGGAGFLPIGSIWEGMAEVEHRRAFAYNHAQKRVKCLKCELKDECSGGCPAVNHLETGNMYLPSAHHCEFVRITRRVREFLEAHRESEG